MLFIKFISGIVNYNNPKSIANKFRQKRFKFFEEQLKKISKPVSILDLGGTQLYWERRGFHNKSKIEITLLNLYKEEVTFDNFISLTGDAANLSGFKDNQFDIVFSNSVIEHLFTKENQMRMANEARRVGKYYFIQTPNKYFPIEPHFLFPLFQFLPFKVKIFLLTKTKLIRGRNYEKENAIDHVKEIRLISLKEFMEFFPNGKIYKEKFMGMTKSFIAHNLPIK